MANIAETLIQVNKYIDTYQDRMIIDLHDICAIKSVAGSNEHISEIPKMVKWLEARLKQLKATTCERFDIGSYTVDGHTIKLPTVILASFGKDIRKRTVLVYGRYDVKDALPEQWSTNPWDVAVINGVIYGRGTCKAKMPLLSWLHTIEAFLMQKLPLPVNIKFVIEGMSERSCFGLEEFLYTKRITFMKGIDFVMINQSEWLNDTIPCISYGTCGICQFDLVCSGGGGGGGGGSSFEPQAIIDYILMNFVDNLGNILIPNLNDDVVQISPEIEQSLEKVDCDLSLIKKNLPPFMHTWSKQKILLRMWQMPQLIADGIVESVSCSCGDGGGDGGGDGAGSGALSTTFVMKIVPVQTPDRCAQFIMEHIGNLMQKRFAKAQYKVLMQRSKNGKRMVCRIVNDKAEVGSVRLSLTSETRAWQEDSVSPHYEATKRASSRVFKNPPNLIKESTDIPIILILDKLIHKNTVLLPLADNRMDDNFANECISKMTFSDGKKLLAAYMAEVGTI